jgi:hypothetical protein
MRDVGKPGRVHAGALLAAGQESSRVRATPPFWRIVAATCATARQAWLALVQPVFLLELPELMPTLRGRA